MDAGLQNDDKWCERGKTKSFSSMGCSPFRERKILKSREKKKNRAEWSREKLGSEVKKPKAGERLPSRKRRELRRETRQWGAYERKKGEDRKLKNEGKKREADLGQNLRGRTPHKGKPLSIRTPKAVPD